MHLVHHVDVAQAAVLALDAPGIDGRTYNVADDEPVAVAEILRLNGETVGEEATNRAVDDPHEGIVETTRIKSELAFRPLHPSLTAAQAAGALQHGIRLPAPPAAAPPRRPSWARPPPH